MYEAVHTTLNSAVALKVVNTRGPYGHNAAARLRREAELCAAVEDPHVPKVYDVGALPDGTPYLVMEKVVGPTLESLLLRGRLGMRLGTLVLRDLLRAVEAVQRAGVVHRDIKPSNIIVQFAADRTPSVRLMDFGVSRSLFFRKGTSAALTRRGTILGTPEYMAPEQIQDQLIDVRTDVYALGVVSYEMFAGRVPFEGEHPAEVVAAVLRREHKPLCLHRPEVPDELEALINRAMESAPAHRFKHAKAMRDELEANIPRALWAPVSSTLGAIAPLAAVTKKKQERRREPLAVRLLVSTCVAITTCAGIVALSPTRQHSPHLDAQAHVAAMDSQRAAAVAAPPPTSAMTMLTPQVPVLAPAPVLRPGKTVLHPVTPAEKPAPSGPEPAACIPRRERRAPLPAVYTRAPVRETRVAGREQTERGREALLPDAPGPHELEDQGAATAKLDELREVVLKSPFPSHMDDMPRPTAEAFARRPLPTNPYSD